jgi:prepilin-type N-terminal cleavage/methylation domain-containing protein
MREGFTLVELMVVMLIFSIILAAVYSVLTVGKASYQTGETQIIVQQEARRAMDEMVRELREASSIDPTTFAEGVSEDIIRFTLKTETIEYVVNARQLQRIVSGTTTILANNIENIQFTLSGGNKVYIVLTAQKTGIFVEPANIVLTSQVVLRN